MAGQVRAIPEGYHTITPYLVIDGAAKALEFYKKAFDAEEIYSMPGPNGKIMHAELQIGDSRLMLSDEQPQMGAKSPKAFGGTPASMFLYVENVDRVFNQAVAAGATAKMPVADMFWGDRFGSVVDPFGHEWQIATHKEDLTPEEIARRGAAAMGAGASG